MYVMQLMIIVDTYNVYALLIELILLTYLSSLWNHVFYMNQSISTLFYSNQSVWRLNFLITKLLFTSYKISKYAICVTDICWKQYVCLIQGNTHCISCDLDHGTSEGKFVSYLYWNTVFLFHAYTTYIYIYILVCNKCVYDGACLECLCIGNRFDFVKTHVFLMESCVFTWFTPFLYCFIQMKVYGDETFF